MYKSTIQRQTLIGSTSKDGKVDVGGLVELESAYNAAIVGLSEYFKESKDRLTRLMQKYDARKAKYSLQK